MPLARDVLKTRPQRIGEVYTHLHEKTGQADSQLVSFGGDITLNAGDNAKFDLNSTEAVIGGAIVQKAPAAANVVLAGGTAAAQFRKVLIQLKTDGSIVQKNGAIAATQADAVKPAQDTDCVELGWLELPASFTPGTTLLTGPMIKKTAYWT